MPERLLGLYEKIVLRHPLAVMIAVLLLAVAMAFGLPNFKLDASADALTLEHDTDLDYFRETLQHYGSSDFLVVTYTPKQGDLFDDASLATLAEIRDALKQIEGVASVTSILDVPLLYSPMVTVSQLKDAPRTLMSKGTDRDQARKEFLESPIYRKLILSPDGQTTALMATMELDRKYLTLVRQRDSLRLKRDTEGLSRDEEEELEQVSKEFLDYRTEKAAEEHQRVAEVREKMAAFKDRATLFLGGPSMITADMIDFIKSDLRVFGSGIVLFIIATLAIIFRQVRWVVLPLFTCVLSVEIMLGYLSWIDWRLTVISSNFVALLLIITLALTIHLIVRYREMQLEYPDRSQIDLVRDTVGYMARPCLYTVLTTVVAFVSLVVSDIRPVIDFGWMMTLGILLALSLAFIVIPAGMMLIGKGRNNDKGDKSAAYTMIFARFTENHGGLVLGLALLAGVISCWGISQLQVENRFIDYFRSHTEIYQGLSVIDDKLGGTTPLDIILDAPAVPIMPTATEDDPFADDAGGDDPFASDDPFGDDSADSQASKPNSYWFTGVGVHDLRKIQNYLDALPEVGKVSSLVTIADVAEDLMGHKLNDLELAFVRNSLSPANAALLFDPYIDEQQNQARITLRIKETGGELKRPELLRQIRHFITEEVGLQDDQVHFTSLLVLYNNMLQSLFRSQILTLGAVFLGVMVMFMVLFRSISISVIAMLPNMLAATVVLGGMGLAGIPLDMMTITIAAITVGIGVDNSIHYITRFKREFVLDQNYLASMHRAHASIGRALFYTAITIIVGFSILSLSNFIPSVYFGLLTGLAMLTALLGSMTLLPKLILIFKPLGK
ncbi:efflux RND transporter permease subunit [Porticoccus sp.]